MRILFAVPLLVAAFAHAETEIHRCVQDDGSIAFQEMPCPEKTPDEGDETTTEPVPAASDDFFDFENPYDQDAEPEPPAEPGPADEACIKDTRNAIDAIDAKLHANPSADDRERYLAELLALTRQLRACKQE